MIDLNFIKDISNILSVDVLELTEEFSLRSCQNWDSLSMVSVIGLIDEYFDKRVDSNDLMACQTLGHLIDLIKSK